MASKSKARPARKKPTANQFADLGLFDIPNLDEMDDDNEEDLSDIDENDLESELAALMRGEAPVKRNIKKTVAPPVDIERMAKECLKDDDDEEEDDDDEDLTSNEDLLKELQALSPVDAMESEETTKALPENVETTVPDIKSTSSEETPEESILNVLQSRLNLYKEAECAAKNNNDTSKARRYCRAIKTLEGLLKASKLGQDVNPDDIPPVVSIPKPLSHFEHSDKSILNTIESKLPDLPQETSPCVVEEKPSSTSFIDVNVSMLVSRQKQYKVAALQAKKIGNKDLAIKYIRTAKTFDAVILAARNNEPIDLNSIPPPMDFAAHVPEKDSQKLAHEQMQTSSPLEIAALEAANSGNPEPELFKAPPAPSSVLEALEQRLQKYKETKAAAEAENNSGKVRRLMRIVKTYETAISNVKAGRPVQFDELPTPPGFAPIPGIDCENSSEMSVNLKKENELKPQLPSAAETNPQNQVPVKRPKIQRTNTSTSEKQLEFLLERQKLFREAALSAKKEGSIQQAKEYLKMSKGFDSMIEATRCGLPIDASSIPTPPQLESDFVVVNVSDCNESSDLTQEELFENLEKDLLNQLETCIKNKNHFLRLGDVQSASKFEKLALETKKDLSVIQFLKKKGELIPPKFHYETRLFSMVMCNADLSDNDMEVIIKRGINLPGKPEQLDSYVRIELPIPSETPQRAKTHTIWDTNNPVFDETFKFEINRKSRSQLRLFKRNSLKCEIWSKGGFLRSDNLLGTTNIKLIPLESKCSLHDSFDLMEGRKQVGGKLEVEIRLRDPLLTKQVEEVQEKWLVIGS